MSHYAENGIRYTAEKTPDGGVVVTAKIDATAKLLSSVTVPPAGVPVLATVFNDAAGTEAAQAAAIDVGALREEIVAGLQEAHETVAAKLLAEIAERDEELAQLRAATAEMALEGGKDDPKLQAAPEPAAEVVPIAEAKKSVARRKAATKK